MFTLYKGREIEWELRPEDFAYICSPEHALEQSKTHYDLDERNYRSRFSPFSVPERLYSRQPTWRRAQVGYVDPIYDSVKEHLQLGWLIGVDTTEQWNWVENPFYVDENGELICDSPDYYHEWFIREITDGYNDAVANRNGVSITVVRTHSPNNMHKRLKPSIAKLSGAYWLLAVSTMET